ncbi:MAG: polysaccharide deacetylase family protein [Myxococcales bacterium]|nr:polysaccharide deacetylase family protein [Myxococcales bacterium]
MNRTTFTGALLLLGHLGAVAAAVAGAWIAALATLLATHALFLLGTLVANSPLFGPVMRSFETPRREVWLTIDDGPDPRTTPALLDCLAAAGAKATFFVVGERAARAPELVERIRAEGHAVADHTRTHPHATFWAALPWRLRREIAPDARLFRSPVGMSNWFVHALLRRRGTVLVGWSVRGLDGINTPRAQVVARIERGVAPGAILALHDAYDAERRGYAPSDVIADVLAALERRGYRAVVPEPNTLRPAAVSSAV